MSKTAEDWYTRGRALQEKDDHAGAAEAFARATVIDPGWPDAWYALGSSCLQARLFPRAADALEHLLELDPQAIDGWFLLGIVRVNRGEREGGIEALAHAVALDPENVGIATPEAYYKLGIFLNHVGRAGEGLYCVNEAERLGHAKATEAKATIWDERKCGRTNPVRPRFLQQPPENEVWSQYESPVLITAAEFARSSQGRPRIGFPTDYHVDYLELDPGRSRRYARLRDIFFLRTPGETRSRLLGEIVPLRQEGGGAMPTIEFIEAILAKNLFGTEFTARSTGSTFREDREWTFKIVAHEGQLQDVFEDFDYYHQDEGLAAFQGYYEEELVGTEFVPDARFLAIKDPGQWGLYLFERGQEDDYFPVQDHWACWNGGMFLQREHFTRWELIEGMEGETRKG